MNQSDYQIIHRKQDIGKRISQLHREEQLAVGIINTGLSSQELARTLDWYLKQFSCCIYVLTVEEHFDRHRMPETWPDVSWLVFSSLPTIGEKINLFADECFTTYFLLVRSDMELIKFDGPAILDMMRYPDHPAVVCPVVSNASGELLPFVNVPHLQGKYLEPLAFLPDEKNTQIDNLYPSFGIGLYDRALFQRLRGYDEDIISDYWQVLDFGIRCWLFGHKVVTRSDLGLEFISRQSVIEERSEQDSTARCYTKALSVRQAKGRNRIKKWGYMVDKETLLQEVKPRIALYKTDFFTLVDHWQLPGEKA